MGKIGITPGPVKVNSFEPISGGTTGQVLTKTDNGYDWSDVESESDLIMKTIQSDYTISTIGSSDELGAFTFAYYSGSALLGQKHTFVLPVGHLGDEFRVGSSIAYDKVNITMGLIKKSTNVYTITFTYVYNKEDAIYYLGDRFPDFIGYNKLV